MYTAINPGAKYTLRFPAYNATLDLDFVRQQGFVAGVSGNPFDRVTFTRGTTKTYFDSAGNMQTAAINTPVIDHDPATLACRGFLSDPTRSNLLLNSLIDKTPLTTQDVTVTAQVYTLSFYGTGTIALSGAATGTLTGTADNRRVNLIFTPAAGTLTLTVSGNVFWGQLEAGWGPTSFIPTAGTAISRSADAAVMTGAAFSDWYTDGGTLFAEYELSSETRNGHVVNLAGTTGNLIIIFAANSAGGSQYVFIQAGGVTQTNRPAAVQSAPRVFGVAATLRPDLVAASLDRAPSFTAPTISIPSVSAAGLGCSTTGGSQMCGWVRRVIYIPSAVTPPELLGMNL